MIKLNINGKSLYEIFDPDTFDSTWDEETLVQQSIMKLMLPTEVALTSETYSRNAERTADYELGELTLINRKAKPEFSWTLLKADYVAKLLSFLEYDYSFKGDDGVIIPREAPDINVAYDDFVGERTISAYLGQTIEGTLVEYEGVKYWQDFRIAFPER